MPIDVNLLREDRGGNPELVRESQRRRFASVELVDEVRTRYTTSVLVGHTRECVLAWAISS
jgi:hypothetical protein